MAFDLARDEALRRALENAGQRDEARLLREFESAVRSVAAGHNHKPPPYRSKRGPYNGDYITWIENAFIRPAPAGVMVAGTIDTKLLRKDANYICDRLSKLSDPDAERDRAGKYPSLLARAYRKIPKSPAERFILTTADREGQLLLARRSGLLDAAFCHPVEAVEVDGEPFASLIPRGHAWRTFQRTPAPLSPSLPFPGPKTWGGESVNDIIIATLSNELFDGDERSTSRSDVARLAEFTLACSGGIAVPESFGAVLVGGQYTAANLRRFWAAALTLGSLHWIIDRIGRFYYIAEVDTDPEKGLVYLAPPAWFHGRGKYGSTRLSGGLFRPQLFGQNQGAGRGTDIGFWSGLHRTIAGLEAVVSWTSPPGRGEGARTANGLFPVRHGGPGPDIFVPWRQVLTMSGEHVPSSAPNRAAGQRYRRRVEALEIAGYRIPPRGGIARAGDTIEIVDVVDGRGGRRRSGLAIRASARFCAAVAQPVERRVTAASIVDSSALPTPKDP